MFSHTHHQILLGTEQMSKFYELHFTHSQIFLTRITMLNNVFKAKLYVSCY